MGKIGYARVSTTDQDLSLQLAALSAAGCGVIRSEKITGSTVAGRAELRTVLDFIGAGDTLVVTPKLRMLLDDQGVPLVAATWVGGRPV